MSALPLAKLFPWKKLAAVILGLAVTVTLIVMIEPGVVWGQLKSALPTIGLILGLFFIRILLETQAWQFAVVGKTSYGSLLKISLEGLGVDAFHPFLLIRGDTIRLAQLNRRFQIPSGAGSLLTDQAIRSLATLIFLGLALMEGAGVCPMGGCPLRQGLFPFLILVGLVAVMIRIFKKGIFYGALLGDPQKGVLKWFSPSVRGALEERDRHFQAFWKTKRPLFLQSLFIHLLSLGLLGLEVYWIGHALDLAFSWSFALTLAGLSIIIRKIFYFLPGAHGVLELLYAGIASLLLGPQALLIGLTIVIVQRIRVFVWATVGLVLVGNPFKVLMK